MFGPRNERCIWYEMNEYLWKIFLCKLDPSLDCINCVNRSLHEFLRKTHPTKSPNAQFISLDTRVDIVMAATLLGCVTAIRPFTAWFAWHKNCGIWVVFPLPVSPITMLVSLAIKWLINLWKRIRRMRKRLRLTARTGNPVIEIGYVVMNVLCLYTKNGQLFLLLHNGGRLLSRRCPIVAVRCAGWHRQHRWGVIFLGRMQFCLFRMHISISVSIFSLENVLDCACNRWFW